MAEAGTTSIPRRSPDTVMKLARLGAFHQSRLSFMRQLLRRLKAEDWRFDKRVFEIDAKGVGHAVYVAHGPECSYSQVAFAHDPAAAQRAGRTTAPAWDATFAPFEGVPTDADIAQLAENLPGHAAGRGSDGALPLSRANRSVRLWDHVVDRLAAGKQPNAQEVAGVGYLMRIDAVFGSDGFGAAGRDYLAGGEDYRGPFQTGMLSVYLTRAFATDLAEHMARMRAPETAMALDPALRRHFGIGGCAGPGTAPFLLGHPVQLNRWIAAREEALARVRSLPEAAAQDAARFRAFAERARIQARLWRSEHPVQLERLTALRADLDALAAHLETADLTADTPWNRLWLWADGALSPEGQEQLVSLLMEPYGALVDDLGATMTADGQTDCNIDGAMPVAELRRIVEEVYGWALAIDGGTPSARTQAEERAPTHEHRIGPGRDAARLHADLKTANDEPVADFLLRHPGHRHTALRAQIAARLPYAALRDNIVDAGMLPIDMLRMTLSFVGTCHFGRQSDGRARINMFQNAPFPDELAWADSDDWSWPALPDAVI